MSTNPYQNQPGANYPQELPQGMAIAALVTGIRSLTLCGIFTAIPAIICGHVGVKQADNGEASGRTMAMAGMIMGYISLALTLLAIIAYVVIIVFVVGAAAAGGSCCSGTGRRFLAAHGQTYGTTILFTQAYYCRAND